MKISYRTHPILEKLESKLLGEMACEIQDQQRYKQHMGLFDKAWKLCAQKFASNIQIITQSFSEAIAMSIKRTLDNSLMVELYNHESAGTFIQGDFVTCYWIYPDANTIRQTYFNFIKHETGKLLINSFMHLSLDKQFRGTSAVYFSSYILNGRTDKEALKLCNSSIVATLNFIKYAEIEVKYLEPKKVINDISCKYVNDTASKISVLDSKWFTTLIKSDAFKVRGHFRLQPYGEGLKDRKLIWINDFVKDGYTAPARKLSHTES